MAKPKRVSGAFVSDEEVTKITDYLRLQRLPEYNADIISQQVQINNHGGVVMDFDGSGDDEYKDAVRAVIEAGKASTSPYSSAVSASAIAKRLVSWKKWKKTALLGLRTVADHVTC